MRRNRLWLLALVLGGVCLAGPAEARRPRRRSARMPKRTCPEGWFKARVTDRSATHTFVSAGSEQGLLTSHRLRIFRRRKQIAQCTVDAASSHFARCPVQSTRPGDIACYAPVIDEAATVEVSAGPGVPARARPPTPGVQEALTTQGVPRVVDHATTRQDAGLFRADAVLSHSSFIRVQGGRSGHRQAVSASARDIPLGFLGARATVDLTVLTYALSSAQARFREQATALLYVHETSVSRRAMDGGWVFSVGRLRPRNVPGVPYLDGAQVGFRFSPQLELGLVGGGLPDMLRLEPTAKRWMAGAYARWSTRQRVLRFDMSARAGLVHFDRDQGEFEAWARLGVQSWLSAAGGLRARADSHGVALSSLRGRVDLRPGAGLSLSLQGRLRDDAPDPYSAGLPILGASHVRGAMHWRGLGWLSLGAVAGWGRMHADDLDRAVMGPEVGLPTLFSTVGGLWAGYREAIGWLPGRSAWLQARLRPAAIMQVWLRTTYREDRPQAGTTRDIGAFVQVGWRVSARFQLRASALSRFALTPGLPPATVAARAAVVASL